MAFGKVGVTYVYVEYRLEKRNGTTGIDSELRGYLLSKMAM